MKKCTSIIIFVLYFAYYDAKGQDVFNRNYDIDSCLNGAICVIQTLDGGYLMGGGSDDIFTGISKALLIKTNSVGDSTWIRQWDFSPIGGDQIGSVLQLNDGSYIALGNTVDTVAMNWDVFLLKLDISGGILWKKTYSIGSGVDLGYMVKKVPDNGFIITGWTTSNTSGDSDAYWIKTDSVGNLEWQ